MCPFNECSLWEDPDKNRCKASVSDMKIDPFIDESFCVFYSEVGKFVFEV